MNRFGLAGCLGEGRSPLIGLAMLCLTALLLTGTVTLPEILSTLKMLEVAAPVATGRRC